LILHGKGGESKLENIMRNLLIAKRRIFIIHNLVVKNIMRTNMRWETMEPQSSCEELNEDEYEAGDYGAGDKFGKNTVASSVFAECVHLYKKYAQIWEGEKSRIGRERKRRIVYWRWDCKGKSLVSHLPQGHEALQDYGLQP
jgi:hypothetical protein